MGHVKHMFISTVISPRKREDSGACADLKDEWIVSAIISGHGVSSCKVEQLLSNPIGTEVKM